MRDNYHSLTIYISSGSPVLETISSKQATVQQSSANLEELNLEDLRFTMSSVASTVIFCFVTIALTFRGEVNSVTFEVTRDELDYFTNITDCERMNANVYCHHSTISCSHCICGVDTTFVTKQGQYGKCIDDNRLGKCIIYFQDDIR